MGLAFDYAMLPIENLHFNVRKPVCGLYTTLLMVVVSGKGNNL